MHLYLIRHGQSQVNLDDLTLAHRDSPLTATGVEQAGLAATWLSQQLTLTEVFASTVSRARQTAGIINSVLDLPITFDDRLREIGTCGPDGAPLPEAHFEPFTPELWGTLQPYTPVTASGESWMQFRYRVGTFVESLVPRGSLDSAVDHDRRILVVCHAGVIEAVMEYIFEKGPTSVVVVETHHTGVTHIEFKKLPNRPDWWLHYHNLTIHLSDELRT